MHSRALIAAVLVAVALAGCSAGQPESTGPAPRYAEQAALPPAAASPVRPGIAGLADEDWVVEVAAATGIPSRALAAYAGAALWKSVDLPSCAVGWNTLAAIGFAESDHGRHGGATIGADGTVSPPIIGVALDGTGTATITDTDGGELDGDAEHDRAVGPFQLIPEAWRNWNVDANGDGIKDPQNFDDQAMAAINYLCRANAQAGLGDMTTEAGWRAGVGGYNSAPSYLDRVARAAVFYGEVVAPTPSSTPTP